jgi:hypothetical protein
MAGRAPEHELSKPRMAIGAHDQEIGAFISHPVEELVTDPDIDAR